MLLRVGRRGTQERKGETSHRDRTPREKLGDPVIPLQLPVASLDPGSYVCSCAPSIRRRLHQNTHRRFARWNNAPRCPSCTRPARAASHIIWRWFLRLRMALDTGPLDDHPESADLSAVAARSPRSCYYQYRLCRLPPPLCHSTNRFVPREVFQVRRCGRVDEIHILIREALKLSRITGPYLEIVGFRWAPPAVSPPPCCALCIR